MKNKPQMSLEEARKVRRNFTYLGVVTFITIAIGTVMMSYLEDLSLLNAIYFSVVALTTVGFGDIYPVTVGGKIFVMIYLLVGIGILAAFANNILRFAIARRVININQDKEDK